MTDFLILLNHLLTVLYLYFNTICVFYKYMLLIQCPCWPYHIFVVVQLLTPVQHFVTSWTAACQASLPFTISPSFPILMFSESVMPSNHLIHCHPLSVLPSIFPSIRVFSNELAFRISWPKYLSFSISPSNECSGLISFMMDWFDLLAVQSAHHTDTMCVWVDYIEISFYFFF